MNEVNKDTVEEMSYADFVRFINQWNTPPGSYTTISEWIQFGKISDSSTILEVACTTGLSSREIANRTGCKALGFDISKKSIETAKENKDRYAPNKDISYRVGDGYTINFDQKFSHIF